MFTSCLRHDYVMFTSFYVMLSWRQLLVRKSRTSNFHPRHLLNLHSFFAKDTMNQNSAHGIYDEYRIINGSTHSDVCHDYFICLPHPMCPYFICLPLLHMTTSYVNCLIPCSYHHGISHVDEVLTKCVLTKGISHDPMLTKGRQHGYVDEVIIMTTSYVNMGYPMMITSSTWDIPDDNFGSRISSRLSWGRSGDEAVDIWSSQHGISHDDNFL